MLNTIGLVALGGAIGASLRFCAVSAIFRIIG
ncbi:MAG: chromosome condensation protein CrcB, partial [Proteobacteria bacterium]|nr:chromosome condensation protein CrcB [Pseudomonadota bacterium]